jgi:deoxyribodipyrimidine photo-lyase
MPDPVLLWLRQDLRLEDQPALVAAAADGPVIPVYILDDEGPGDWRMGGAQRWYLHHALETLAGALESKGSRLILRRGGSVAVLRDLMEDTGAAAVHAIRHYEPWWRRAEAELGEAIRLHDGNHLVRIEDVVTGAGTPFRVYGAFWKALEEFLPPDLPVAAPGTIPAPERWPASDTIDDLDLLPSRDWADRFPEMWTAGEKEALATLDSFGERLAPYAEARNMPSTDGSSRLSPHLHFGEVSPRTVWHALKGDGEGLATYRKEIAWRDFSSGLITTLPDYADRNGRPKMDALPWRSRPDAALDLKAWQQGRTGYPIVDAGMRQLWMMGWMHNRLRMITASFLIKHLLIDWREGERWFWDCLVDADYGNNAVNWQWVAGTGVDANMFSRIMAPLSQSEKFDAGDYIRRWVPELARVPELAIHDPDAAGARPDAYPAKIIGHREARERALAALALIR